MYYKLKFSGICFLSQGIGRATAKALVQCGAEVIALTRTQADLDTLVKEVGHQNRRADKRTCITRTSTIGTIYQTFVY